MNADTPSYELGALLSDLEAPRVLVDAGHVTRLLTGVIVWAPGDYLPDDPARIIVCTGLGGDADQLGPVLALTAARVIILTGDEIHFSAPNGVDAQPHTLISTASSAGHVAAVVGRLTQTMDESVSRRLASLQRTLSQALTDPVPIPALLNRLKRVTNATSAVIDQRGAILHSTGPVPRALLFERISSTPADTQSLSIDGWRGVATRIADLTFDDQHSGWLVLTSRRPDFPDTYSTSAAHVAASLIEASQRMSVVAREQERAIRASVLEQALALRHERRDNELTARIAGFGITFEAEVRVAVAILSRSPRADQRQQARESLLNDLLRLMTAAGHPALLTTRGNGVTMLIQCSSSTLQRVLAAHQDDLPPLHVGIGRPLTRSEGVEGVADSFHDAQLAARTIRRVAVSQRVMAYEDFDFATRLFADVGLDRMVEWAKDFLSPLAERETLMSGLRAYFELDQNINLAAESLSIHHNSLRYRLAKVEELLTINLKQPAAISSIFLALTAIDLTRQPRTIRPRTDAPASDIGDVAASAAGTQMGTDHPSGPGAVIPSES
ncbi:helix-turn-helix domain-containing protein [Nocardioides sp. KIGAM211]|uniref:Helix-turn-helix domain-containing protein n=1 Tax=Nocardioides luti TaxID=2761101 RepID=A0A7X0RIC0_9ACTN|nr:helix-turn-helix domain-containing protein [Nocardioides luti]MBB6627589.1 helix-turn-helix domain-containing protein [Nocardioides luti]